MARLFTVDEVRALLPRLGALARQMQERKAELDRHHEAFELLAGRARSDGDRFEEPMQRHREAMQALADEVQELIAQIHALGAEVKGIDRGVVDFLSERDGRVVYLCWMLDEPDIEWWHELHTGFGGRQPL